MSNLFIYSVLFCPAISICFCNLLHKDDSIRSLKGDRVTLSVVLKGERSGFIDSKSQGLLNAWGIGGLLI